MLNGFHLVMITFCADAIFLLFWMCNRRSISWTEGHPPIRRFNLNFRDQNSPDSFWFFWIVLLYLNLILEFTFRDGTKTTILAQKPSKFATAWKPTPVHYDRTIIHHQRNISSAPICNFPCIVQYNYLIWVDSWLLSTGPAPLTSTGLVDPVNSHFRFSHLSRAWLSLT